jgi:hypothetical protein
MLISVKYCLGLLFLGATVVSGTTIAGGCVDLNIGTAGTYTVVYALATYNTRTDTGVSLVCGTIVNANIRPTSVPAGYAVCICGCMSQAPGPTLTVAPGAAPGTMNPLIACRWTLTLGANSYQFQFNVGSSATLIINGVTSLFASSLICSPLHVVFTDGVSTYTITP